MIIILFFFNDTATTEIYTLSLHDALPILYMYVNCISMYQQSTIRCTKTCTTKCMTKCITRCTYSGRSEEHTSELQSRLHLVCRLLLEKKKKKKLNLRSRNKNNNKREDEGY